MLKQDGNYKMVSLILFFSSDATKNTPTIEEIEQRLAVLRECDVELIKNPRAVISA